MLGRSANQGTDGQQCKDVGIEGPTGKYVRVPARTSQKAPREWYGRRVRGHDESCRWQAVKGRSSIEPSPQNGGETNGDTEASPGKPGTPEGDAS